jgi:hypothetical protein
LKSGRRDLLEDDVRRGTETDREPPQLGGFFNGRETHRKDDGVSRKGAKEDAKAPGFIRVFA